MKVSSTSKAGSVGAAGASSAWGSATVSCTEMAVAASVDGSWVIGSKVKVYDVEYDEEVEYKILGKSDLDNGIISDLSPVGSALMGKKVGEIAEVHTPSGKVLQLKVLAISK